MIVINYRGGVGGSQADPQGGFGGVEVHPPNTMGGGDNSLRTKRFDGKRFAKKPL